MKADIYCKLIDENKICPKCNNKLITDGVASSSIKFVCKNCDHTYIINI